MTGMTTNELRESIRISLPKEHASARLCPRGMESTLRKPRFCGLDLAMAVASEQHNRQSSTSEGLKTLPINGQDAEAKLMKLAGPCRPSMTTKASHQVRVMILR